MHRRQFISFVALLSAGAAAKPEQILAFQKYYDLNAPQSDDLIMVDRLHLGGMCQKSTVVQFRFFSGDKTELSLAMNGFGGVLIWTATPDSKIIGTPSELRWEIFGCLMHELEANMSYIDNNGIRQVKLLTTRVGTFA